MANESFNLDAYFKRVNYKGKTDISLETLNGLHVAHTLNVPFENLDVFFGKEPLLDRESLYKKIVENNRGGYCFEMNGLFSFVLQEIGFNVTNLLARPTQDGISYDAKAHQAILVKLEGKDWLVDVGFGKDGITAPLLLVEQIDQKQFSHTYRILPHSKFGYLLQYKVGDDYLDQYAFSLEESYPIDYKMSNHFTATFSESFFTTMKLCTMPTPNGRVTLTDTRFKCLENGQMSEITLSNDMEFNELLKKHFGMDLDLIKSINNVH